MFCQILNSFLMRSWVYNWKFLLVWHHVSKNLQFLEDHLPSLFVLSTDKGMKHLFFFFFTVFEFYFIFKLYITVLVLPNIKMNPPQVHMCSPSWTPSLLPPHSIPLGRPSAPAPSIQYRASNLDWWLVSYMILYMFQCHSSKSFSK